MILSADRIITGDGKTVLKGQAIRVEGAKIAEIGPLSELQEKYKDTLVKEYHGATILPGLIDMHVHIGSQWATIDPSNLNDFTLAYFAADYAKKVFSKGITTMRDVASRANLCKSINYAVKQGYFEAPRLFSTDNALCFTGGHGHGEGIGHGVIEVDGPWALRTAIRDNIKRGAQWTKIMASHRSDIPEYTQEELDAAVHESHRVGKKTAVHAGTQPSIQMAIDAGFDTIEHGTYLTVEQAKQMAKKGIVWVPTIVAYTSTYEWVVQNMERSVGPMGASFVEHKTYFGNAAAAYKNNFKALYETGVKIAAGTDVVFEGAPVTPIGREIMYFAEYGMPALEAIQAATKNGAETLDIGHLTGEIAAGKEADILIIDGDPLTDIGAVENVSEVYLGGKQVFKK